MKIKNKKITILLIIGFIFPLILSYKYNSKNDISSFIDNPHVSAEYTVNFIHIDGSIPGNWSTTTSYDWCSGDGSWSNPYKIENVTIDASSSPTGYGIYIQDSNVFFIIQNCKIYNSPDYGIYLDFVNNSVIFNNNCSNNGYAGIALVYKCSNNTISENIVNNNDDSGIYFYEENNNNTIFGNTANQNGGVGISLHWHSNNTIIKENIVNENAYYGIELYDYCGYNTVSDNTINNNGERGIDLEYYSRNNMISKNLIENNVLFGVYLESYCIKNTFIENTIRNSSEGLYLDSNCNFNVITGNGISENLMFGIYLTGGGEGDESKFNMIIDNLISENTVGVCIDSNSDNNSLSENLFVENLKHAIDNGADNKWNTSTIGNYWDNHTGLDNNKDGIVDTPYTHIGGSAGSIDYLPIAPRRPDGLDPVVIAVIVVGSVTGAMVVIGIAYMYFIKRKETT